MIFHMKMSKLLDGNINNFFTSASFFIRFSNVSEIFWRDLILYSKDHCDLTRTSFRSIDLFFLLVFFKTETKSLL